MSPSRFFYSLLLYLLLPLVLLRLLFKSRKNKHYRLRIKERLGWVKLPPRDEKPIIWIHVVSVGETIASKPLIKRLLQDYPQHALLVSSTTPTGSATVTKLFGDHVLHAYFPYDLPHVVRRFLQKVNPQLLIIVETEIWPNLYAACKQRNIPVLMVNARLSKRSTRQYSRIMPLMRETLSYTTLIAVRSEEDRQHFLSLGATTEKFDMTGNIKFDIDIDNKKLAQGELLRQQWGDERPVWVASSTHQGEDAIILRIFKLLQQHFPDLLLILVPRHPERFIEVGKLITQQSLRLQRRSDHSAFLPETEVILGDSMGELLLWYATANVAFIGGSLVPTGGHNPLEATSLGVPVISGPYIFNFSDIYPPLCAAHIAWVEQNEPDIEEKTRELLASKDDYKTICSTFMQQQRGAVNKLIGHIKRHLIP